MSHVRLGHMTKLSHLVDPGRKEKLGTTVASHHIQVAEKQFKVAENPPGVSTARLKTTASTNSLLLFDPGHECCLYFVDEF